MTDGAAARTTARELARRRRRYGVGRVLARWGRYAASAAAALLCAAPFAWGLVTLLGEPGGAAGRVRALLRSTPFPEFAANTLVVGVPAVLITLALALPAAYALTRLGRRWGGPVGVAIVLACLVPPSLLAVPLSWIAEAAGLRGSLWSLVLVLPTITVPVSVWLLMRFLAAIPRDLEEQALVDGHSRLGAFARVVVPLLLPGLAAVAVLAFTLAAGDFVYARTLARGSYPLGAGVPARPGGDPGAWRAWQAGILLVAAVLALAVGLVLDRLIAAGTPDRPTGAPDRPTGTPDRPAGMPDQPAGTPDRPAGAGARPPRRTEY